MKVELSKKEIENIVNLIDDKLEQIGIIGDPGERFDYGVLKEKLILSIANLKPFINSSSEYFVFK